MAINHSGHDHPATPAGRAACRKTMAVGAVADRKPQVMIVAPRRGRKPAQVDAKPRGIRNIGDMPDVPHVFSTAIHAAWDNGWTVTTGHPYNDDEKRILITSAAGELALVHRAGNAGVWGVFWRPVNSSITSRVTDAPVIAAGVSLLGGA
jgi:hypothetical protein